MLFFIGKKTECHQKAREMVPIISIFTDFVSFAFECFRLPPEGENVEMCQL